MSKEANPWFADDMPEHERIDCLGKIEAELLAGNMSIAGINKQTVEAINRGRCTPIEDELISKGVNSNPSTTRH